MTDQFRPLDRETPIFLQPSIQEWLPEQHLGRFVVEIVEQLELSEITSRYSVAASQPITAAAVVLRYATGVFSSRKPRTYDSVAFRYISAGAS